MLGVVLPHGVGGVGPQGVGGGEMWLLRGEKNDIKTFIIVIINNLL